MTGEETSDPLIGARIGPCRIEERLAAGGMGVVYRATHVQLGQPAAVKILAPSLAADNEYVTRFFREAGAAGQIDHPNVVRVMDVGKHEDKYYLVMEFVEGETLDRILDRDRRLPLERATRLVREIAAGLAAAHRAGIVHRDVKPGNVIVSFEGRPHLTDFGLARHTETRKGLTIEGTFLGTPEYASPEQVEGRRLDHRTDLYSLGVTYYQLLSGTLPFLGESPMEIAIKRTKEPARPLESVMIGADPRACALVRRLLATEAGLRPQSATDVIRELDEILKPDRPGPEDAPKAKTTARKPLVDLYTRRRIRSIIHWDLLTLAIALAFLSGGMAERGGGFLEMWVASDAGRALRVLLLGAAVLAAAGAVFVYRREFTFTGRMIGLIVVVVVMLGGALAAGTFLDRYPASGTIAAAAASVRALAGALGEPVNLLALGLLAIFWASVVSFEHQPGSHRVVLSRILLLVGFALVYGFGARGSLGVPIRTLTSQMELTVPLGIATLLALVFGLLLLTGYNFERGSRLFGLVLTAGGAAGIYTWAILAAQPERTGWTALLGEPFDGLGLAFLRSGTLLVAVAAVGVLEQAIVSAGLRRLDRFYRRKPS
jgi:hypothetical protein